MSFKKVFQRAAFVLNLTLRFDDLLGKQVDSGVPSIFPEDHNLNKGQKVFSSLFYDTSQAGFEGKYRNTLRLHSEKDLLGGLVFL